MTGEPDKHSPDNSSEISPLDLLDWRTRAPTQLTADVPAAYPGGPSHKAGALVVQETVGRDANGRNVGFATPSAVAMALSIALKAAERAQNLRPEIAETTVVSPFGPSTSVTHESTPTLYDYFEECMAALTFSFQALEAYCNEVISYEVATTYTFKRRKKSMVYSADELERALSTEEKIGIVLPDLLGVPPPKGRQLWEAFLQLKKLRDATIHLKSRDSAPRVMKPSDLEDATLFVRLLDADASSWPKTAITLIAYFADQHVMFPWITHLIKKAGVRPKRPVMNQATKAQLPRGQRPRAA